MPSPTCTVNTLATPNGVQVNGGDDLTIALQDVAGVTSWSLTVIGTDGNISTASATAQLVVDPITKTATYTGGVPDIGGLTFIFQSAISGSDPPVLGRDINGDFHPEYTTTFEVHVNVLNTSLRYLAANETTEGNQAAGWVTKVNAVVESEASSAAAIATATNQANVNTVVERDSSGGDQFIYLQLGAAANANYASAGQIRAAKPFSQKVRNNANSADVSLVASDSTDNLTFGDNANAASLTLASAGSIILSTGASTAAATIGVAGVTLAVPAWKWTSAVTAPSISQTVLAGTGSAAGQGLSISAQAGQQQTGVTANNNGGGLTLSSGAAGTGGSGAAGVAGPIALNLGAAAALTIATTGFTLGVSAITWGASVTTPSISQTVAASGAGTTMTHYAQGGASAQLGGNLTIGGGPGGTGALAGATRIDLGTAVSNVSAKLSLLVGGSSVLDISQSSGSSLTMSTNGNNLSLFASGAAINQTMSTTTIRAQGLSGIVMRCDLGAFQFQTGAGPTNQMTIDATGLGFYAHATVAQPARVGQLTDSTAGTPGSTLAAVTGTTYSTDIPTIRNWIASLAAKVNDLELVDHNNGLTA